MLRKIHMKGLTSFWALSDPPCSELLLTMHLLNAQMVLQLNLPQLRGCNINTHLNASPEPDQLDHNTVG